MAETSETYFLTGATGFVGGRLVEVLLEEGHDVVALARTPTQATGLEASGVDLREGDILEPATMRDPMAGVDGVFHLAGAYDLDPDNPEQMRRINVDGTRNVLELARELGVPKTVYTSTLATNSDTGGELVDESYRFDGQHRTVYDETKWAAHYEVAAPRVADGMGLVIVSPGVIYGPGDRSPLGRAFQQYLRGDLPAISSRTAFCWSHVEDTARAHYLAMVDGEPGEEYIIAGEPATLVEVFEIAEVITGIDAPAVLPPWVFGVLASIAGVLDRFVSLPETYGPESLRMTAGSTYIADNAKAKRELGVEHRPLEEGLRETLEAELDRLD